MPLAREDLNPNDPVLAEILGAHFADYRRSLIASVPFGLMAMWLIWGTMPAGLVLGWFAAYLATSASRLALSYAYEAPIRDATDLRERMQFAIGGHALGGLAWGVIGTAALVLAPGHHENALAIFFIVVVFATYQAADHARYEPAYAAWLLFALVPNVLAAALQQDPIYHVLGGMGALFLLIITITGRRSNQLMMDSIAKRLENARLLTDMLVQKEALAEANLSKTRFLAAASHDLR
ncbi:MAG TPA: hypothetical protein VGI57_02620, partial [Usitatibacter sp.]